jgi:hypothetical protein
VLKNYPTFKYFRDIAFYQVCPFGARLWDATPSRLMFICIPHQVVQRAFVCRPSYLSSCSGDHMMVGHHQQDPLPSFPSPPPMVVMITVPTVPIIIVDVVVHSSLWPCCFWQKYFLSTSKAAFPKTNTYPQKDAELRWQWQSDRKT